MDAVEYLRQRKRLCDSILENEKYGVDCPHCPLFNEIGLDCCELENRAPESAVRIVSEWDATHHADGTLYTGQEETGHGNHNL